MYSKPRSCSSEDWDQYANSITLEQLFKALRKVVSCCALKTSEGPIERHESLAFFPTDDYRKIYLAILRAVRLIADVEPRRMLVPMFYRLPGNFPREFPQKPKLRFVNLLQSSCINREPVFVSVLQRIKASQPMSTCCTSRQVTENNTMAYDDLFYNDYIYLYICLFETFSASIRFADHICGDIISYNVSCMFSLQTSFIWPISHELINEIASSTICDVQDKRPQRHRKSVGIVHDAL